MFLSLSLKRVSILRVCHKIWEVKFPLGVFVKFCYEFPTFGQTLKETPRTQIHMGHLDFGTLMDKEENKRGILHRTLQSSPK